MTRRPPAAKRLSKVSSPWRNESSASAGRGGRSPSGSMSLQPAMRITAVPTSAGESSPLRGRKPNDSDLGDGPEVEAVRCVHLQDGLHHDHPAKCSASFVRIASQLRRATSSTRSALSAHPIRVGALPYDRGVRNGGGGVADGQSGLRWVPSAVGCVDAAGPAGWPGGGRRARRAANPAGRLVRNPRPGGAEPAGTRAGRPALLGRAPPDRSRDGSRRLDVVTDRRRRAAGNHPPLNKPGPGPDRVRIPHRHAPGRAAAFQAPTRHQVRYPPRGCGRGRSSGQRTSSPPSHSVQSGASSPPLRPSRMSSRGPSFSPVSSST